VVKLYTKHYEKNKAMTKDDMIQIALSAFSDKVFDYYSLSNQEMFVRGNTYRLHDKNSERCLTIPMDSLLIITIDPENRQFIQFNTGSLAFNHYAGIKRAIELGIVDEIKIS
jgi:hypothetical protein